MKALARLVGPVPGHDQPIELQDLLLEAEQLSAERGKARASNLRHPFVARVGNNMQQFRDSFTPYRRDDTELGEVRADRINHRSLLANEQMAYSVKRQPCRSSAASRRALHKLAALIARYGRVPEVRVTNSETRHRPLCQPGMVTASGRMPGRNDASTDGE